MDNLRESLAPQVQTMQVVVAGLTISPIIFAIIVLVINVTPLADEPATILSTICLLIGLVGLVAHRPVGRLVEWQSLRALGDRVDNPTALGGVYMSALLISLSMTEGAAFLNLIGYMMTHSPYTYGMAALLVLVNLMKFPTLDIVVDWARSQAQRIEEEKSFG